MDQLQSKRRLSVVYAVMLAIGLVLGILIGHFVSFNFLLPNTVEVSGKVSAPPPAIGYSNETITFSAATTYCQQYAPLGSPPCFRSADVNAQNSYSIILSNNQEYYVTVSYSLGNLSDGSCRAGVLNLDSFFRSSTFDVHCS